MVPWENIRLVMSIASRHSGTGIISIACSTGSLSSSTNVASLLFCNASFSGCMRTKDDLNRSWFLYFNPSTATISLYWYGWDFNYVNVDVLQNVGSHVYVEVSCGEQFSELPSDLGTRYQVETATVAGNSTIL